MGVSTYSILWSLWLAKTKKTPRGIIYWLPDSSNVSDFVKTKIDSLVNENDELIKALAAHKSESNNQGLKFFYNTPIYFRGLKSKVGVKAISADAAVYDEFDEADQSQVAQARKRLSASEIKLERELSTPTIPDFGINKQFQETDQLHYGFKCTACSTWNILEEKFPDCFTQNKNGDYFHCCYKCKKQLDISSGSWIIKYPNNKIRGYQISQLYSPFVSANEIMHEYNTTEFISHFYNHVLGIPYLSATDKITKEMIYSLTDNIRQMQSNSINQTVIGVDVGSVLHVTVYDYKNKKLINAMDVKNFEELDILMIKFNAKLLVIDALPETRKVRELIERQKGKVFACFYNDHQKGSYGWNEKENIVTVNRTESLDASSLLIFRKDISFFQRNDELEELAEHFSNIAKTVEEDRDSGDKRYVYKKIGPDHYRHSFNYAIIAASRLKNVSTINVFR